MSRAMKCAFACMKISFKYQGCGVTKSTDTVQGKKCNFRCPCHLFGIHHVYSRVLNVGHISMSSVFHEDY